MNAKEKAQLQREHGISVAVVCGYCGEEVVEAIEILDAMPGEPDLACEPCLDKHRPMRPPAADQGPGSPCPTCDEASVVDGCCVACGAPRPCSNCEAMTHGYMQEDEDGLWDEDCRYHSKINDDGSPRRAVRR